MSRRTTNAKANEKQQTEAKETVAAVFDKKKEISQPRMYVGPTISGVGIQNRVYSEVPAGALEVAKELPEVKNLFIPVVDYPMANRMLRERQGYIYSAYTKALKIKNGGNKS